MSYRTLISSAAVAAFALAACAAPARAQLSLSFFPSALALSPGDSTTFDVTLTNLGVDSIALVGFSSDLIGPDPFGTLVWTVDPFESGAPLDLAGGDSYIAQMSMTALTGGTAGVYTGTYEIEGADFNGDPVFASALLSVDVTSPTASAPEPGSLVLCALGLGSLRLVRRRRG